MSFNPPFTVPLPAFTTGASLTGTLTRTAIASVVMKGNTLGLNDGLFILFSLSITNNANNKTYELEFGSSNIMNVTEASQASRQLIKTVQNRNSLSSQVSTRLAEVASYGISASALVTMAENTANDIAITIYGTLTNTGDTITVNYIMPIIWKAS